MTFAQILSQLRKENHMTQEELAVKLEVSRQAISRWEMGNAYPDSVNLLKIARLFNVTTDYLLDNKVNCDIEDVDVEIKHTDEQVLIDGADNIMMNSTFKETYQKKVNSIIKYVNIGEYLILSILCAIVKGNAEFFITAGVLIAISFMASGIFRYVLNTESYDLISGVNTKKYKYDVNELKKIMLNIEFVFIINGLIISNIIMLLGILNTLPQKQGDLFALICALIYGLGSFVVVLMFSTRIKPKEQ